MMSKVKIGEKVIPACVIDGVEVPEHILRDDGVRVLDGVEYGHGKSQVRPEGCRRVTSNTVGLSDTKQSFAPECDIQNIVKRAFAGQPVSTSQGQPMFGDFADLPDYQTALNNVVLVDGMFNGLDALTRQRFGNSPQRMLDFISNPANARQAVEMGLLDPSILSVPAEPSVAPTGGVAAPVGAEGTGS